MSKIIKSESDYLSWSEPEMEGSSQVSNDLSLSPKLLEEMKRQARREGFNQGYREGKVTGEKFMRQKSQTLEQLIDLLIRPLDELDKRVNQELVNLAMVIAKQIVYSELTTSPEQVLAVVKEALRMLPVGVQKIHIKLHADDVHLVHEALPGIEGNDKIDLLEDSTLHRGELEVFADDSYIDATFEGRIAQLATKILDAEDSNGA